MSSFPLLFDLGSPKPTSRDVANTVKAGGTAALTEAQRRADEARYQEITCRSALNPVKGMPFDWTLNPYRGCTHGCHYCYARRYHAQFEMDADDEFASVILVKKNFVEVLTRQLAKPSWKGDYIAVGTATDCYQPIEGHYKLTRGSLEALVRARNPAGVITKGPMVVRDRDVLADLSRVASCTVYISVPTVDEDAWRQLEPGTAHPMQRLRAVRQLRKAGINAGVLMAPVVPGFTTQPARLEATIKAIADHGAAFMGANIMYLKGGTRDHFLHFVAQEFPERLEGYRRMYPGAYAPRRYADTVRGLINTLRDRYDVARRATSIPPQADGDDNAPPSSAAEQATFVWS
jgi:DNA repair photolyase